MKKISTKLSLVIFCCAFFAIILLGAISIVESHKLAKKEAEDSLQWMAQDYANRFSIELAVIEDRLIELEQLVKNTIDFDRLQTDRAYLAQYEQEIAPRIQQFADTRTESVAGWLYFDPKWSDEAHDVYFVDQDGDGMAERQAYIPLSYYDNTPTETDDKQWWYGPIAKGDTFWTNPYPWQLVNGSTITVVSAARPVYINDTFVCVVGTYYRFDRMKNEISSIQVFDTGYAALFNEKMDAVIHPNLKSGTRFTSDNLATVQDGFYADVAAEMLKTPNGLLYSHKNGEDNLFAYSTLCNGWVMAIVPPNAELYGGVNALFMKLLVALVLCIIIVLCAAMIIGRHIARPLLHIADAARVIGTGNLDVHVSVNTKDEIKQLADSLNSMTDNIKTLQGELVQQAYYDEVTGARNQSKFFIDAHEMLQANPDIPYAVIKLDIDRFKLLNDIYGFATGDKILKATARALEEICDAQYDVFARINADDFVLLISQKSKEKEERFFTLIERYIGEIISEKVSLCQGWYEAEPGEQDVQAMFERANFAHRLAKRTDQTACAYDSASRALALEQKHIEAHADAALAGEEFLLYLQPKYQLDNETVVSAEALVRWSINGELLSPARFIPIFEKNGFITKLDIYMFRKACQLQRSWMDNGITPMPISVNFSRLHINNPHFVQELSDIADSYGIPHTLLEVEITETVISDNIDTLQSVLDALHGNGFTLSMDDFGTGYSSLGLLKSIPVDVLKMDKTFFDDSIDSARARIVISSVIRMAKQLGICTVAEGVETIANVELLRALGCDIVQGYYFGRPMPAAQFTDLIK